MQSLISTYAEWVVKGIEAGVLNPGRGQFRCVNEQRCSTCPIVDPNSENGNLCMCPSLLDSYNATSKHQHKHDMNKFERTYITPLLTKSHPEHFL